MAPNKLTFAEKELFLVGCVLSSMSGSIESIRGRAADNVKYAETSAEHLGRTAVIVARAALKALEDENGSTK